MDNTAWYTRTVVYDSALKRNEVLARAATWMNLEDITRSELSRAEEGEYCMIPLR